MLDLEFGRRERVIDAPEHILFSIGPSVLQHDFLDPSSTHFPKVRFSFDIPHSLLLVKMSSPEHGAAIEALSTEVIAALILICCPEKVRFFKTESCQWKRNWKISTKGVHEAERSRPLDS